MSATAGIVDLRSKQLNQPNKPTTESEFQIQKETGDKIQPENQSHRNRDQQRHRRDEPYFSQTEWTAVGSE